MALLIIAVWMLPVEDIKEPVENEVNRQRNIDIMQCTGVIGQRIIDRHQQIDNV